MGSEMCIRDRVKGLYTAYTGMVNEQNRMDIMTNNLANASTVGYKKEGSTSQSFNDVLTVKIKDQSVGMRNVQKIGIKNPGVKIGENYTDYTQGSFRITDNTYYQPIEGAKTTTADAQVKSGYLEMANVQIVSEMVNLISITRAYESNQKVVQTIDGTLDVAANQIGKL